MREEPLIEALASESWQASEWYRRSMPKKVDLEIVCDSDPEKASVIVNDVPVSFNQRHRRFAPRHVLHDTSGKSVDNTDSRVRETFGFDWFSAVSREDPQ